MSAGRSTPGLGEPAREAAHCLDEVARIFGLTSRYDVLKLPNGRYPVVPGIARSEAEAAAAAVVAAMHRFRECTRNYAVLNDSLDPIIWLVRSELGLPWPWVGMELLDRFIRGIQRMVIDVPASATYEIAPTTAPAVRYVFETTEGEPLEAAKSRLRAEFAQVMDALTSRGEEKGRSPRDGARITRNVNWWYRLLLKEPRDTQYRLAQEYWAGKGKPGKDNDSTVAAGIRMADELLSTCLWVWKQPQISHEPTSPDRAK